MQDNYQKEQENKGLIAISKTLARAKDGMAMQEKKMTAIFLSKIEWKNVKENLEIWVEKREIMNLLGSKIDTTDQSYYLRKLAQSTVHHSELHFDGDDKDEWEDMPLFTRRKSTKNMLMMELYSGVADLVQGLKCDYITLFLGDILKFDSNTDGLRAYTLYEYLRLHSDSRRINARVISTKEFKELFGIPKDGKGSYMRENGGFDRSNFEKYVIEPVLMMLAKCEHVVLHDFGKDAKGKPVYYNKIKKNGMVQGYELMYSINKYPSQIKKESIIDEPKKKEKSVPEAHIEKQMSFEDPKTFDDYMKEAELVIDCEAAVETPNENQRKEAIGTIVEMMSEQKVTPLQARQIYDSAKGDMKQISKVYNHFKNKNSDNFVGLIVSMVKPNAFIEPIKTTKKTGFNNFDGRSKEESIKIIEQLEKASAESLARYSDRETKIEETSPKIKGLVFGENILDYDAKTKLEFLNKILEMDDETRKKMMEFLRKEDR